MQKQYDISVIGAGSYGTALAICIARNGHNTLMWARNAEQVALMQQENENKRYLAGIPFPESLDLDSDLEQVVKASKNILIVVPSHAFSETLKQIIIIYPDSDEAVQSEEKLDHTRPNIL